jgi:two-component system, OmpR family, response regulator
MRILIVEDDRQVVKLVRQGLEQAGFPVDEVGTCAAALAAARSFPYAVVILDRVLPDGDGANLISTLGNAMPAARFLLVSALQAPADRIEGLDRGADDYIAKPFALSELMARVRALLRRSIIGHDMSWQIGGLRYWPGKRCFATAAGPLILPRRELCILEALMRSAHRVILREDLVEAAYGFDDDIAPSAIEAHLSRLRRKLDRDRAGVAITAVRGVGYCMSEQC